MLEYVHRMNNKYNPQTFLEECKYEIKNNKMKNFINDDFDLSSSDESDNESDHEESNGSDDEESNNKSENGFDNGSNNETDD